MRFIRGHNSTGMNRSKPWKTNRYLVEDRGYTTPCWVWQLKVTREGYPMLGVGGQQKTGHRWYYEEAHGPIPEGGYIDHLCRVRACVNPAHMEVVSQKENTRRGLSAKLTYEQSVEICRRRRAGETVRALGDEFGVSKETVRLIGLNGPDDPRRGPNYKAPSRAQPTTLRKAR